ncbi:type II toxin-antitoxin system Phd/YefM family antitoxin [Legionella gresilensis]|uniref:type II toxin-antitoxin system Phd/YefM family antitoxin n=1 Tax=Legionella gresilensis TaxID=91823 RepID=UPI001041940D|nr:type II toxin-antitoxin system Phd/YefM family antitoxin [Legionella gresilensis]
MQIITYTYMREHLSEIMEKIANGEQICFARKGHKPFILGKVGTPTNAQLEKAKQKKRAHAIAKLKERHAATIKDLADK